MGDLVADKEEITVSCEINYDRKLLDGGGRAHQRRAQIAFHSRSVDGQVGRSRHASAAES